ncbi:MAG: type II toxin-antitoxin system VapC family toxin [Acidimicrobiales bacterium]
MIAYFDTSAVVPLLVDEPASERACLLWDQAERIAVSRLLYAEGRAALAMASRTGRISRSGLRRSVDGLERLCSQTDVVEPSQAVVRRAGALAEAHGLRGYDAVHLASAETLADVEVVLVAGDGALCRAASALGIAVGPLG